SVLSDLCEELCDFLRCNWRCHGSAPHPLQSSEYPGVYLKEQPVCRMADRLLFLLDSADGGENLLGKGDHQTTEQAEEALGTLAGVMGLDAHAHLDNTPAQDDDTNGLDDVENEVGQAVDNGQRVRTSGHS